MLAILFLVVSGGSAFFSLAKPHLLSGTFPATEAATGAILIFVEALAFFCHAGIHASYGYSFYMVVAASPLAGLAAWLLYFGGESVDQEIKIEVRSPEKEHIVEKQEEQEASKVENMEESFSSKSTSSTDSREGWVWIPQWKPACWSDKIVVK